MWKIGNVEINNQVVLAPMAGISNTSYRKIIKEMGAGLIFAEMVSDKAICYDNDKTLDMLKMSEEERPIAQQIFGSDKESFVKAAQIIEEKMHPDIILKPMDFHYNKYRIPSNIICKGDRKNDEKKLDLCCACGHHDADALLPGNGSQ